MKQVSIIIPCRNEKNYIEKCLQSIVSCNYDKSALSVYVCDGKSDDGTIEIIKSFSTQHPFIYYIENKQKTTPFALNLGLKASDSDIKIILGAHAEIHPEYIQECLKVFDQDPQIACVGGIIENVYENKTAEIIGKAMSSSFGVGNAHFRTGLKDGYVDTVAFGAYTKDIFNKIGYFDEELIRNQDDEFNFRILKNGYKIYLSRFIKSKYYVRASYAKLFKQYYQYGYWKVYVNKKHNTITTTRQLVPAFFVSFLIVGLCLSLFSKMFFILYFLLLMSYVVLGLTSASKQDAKLSAIFPIFKTFFILHLSYGLGYLRAIIDFFIIHKEIKKEEKLSR